MKIRGGVERVTVLRRDASGNAVREDYKVDDLDDNTGIEYVVRDRTGRVRRGELFEDLGPPKNRGELFEDLGPPKKQTKVSRALDKRIRKAARRNMQTVSRYLTLHDRSNRLKKNGWMRDLGKNLRKAMHRP